MTQLFLQALLGAAGSVVAAVVGWLLTRQLRIIFATAERTEQHAQTTADRVSQLDIVSTSSWRTSVDTRIEGLAERRSDELAWQAKITSRLANLERRQDRTDRFMEDLDAYAHGHASKPALGPRVTDDAAPQSDRLTEGALP